MASISYSGATETQITVNIAHNGSVVDNFEIRRSPGGVLVSSGSFTASATHSAQRTAIGLSPSTSYSFTVNYYRGSTFVASASDSWSTLAPPAPGATTITGFGYGNPNQYVPTTVTANWSAANGATSYDYRVVALGIEGNTASTSFSFVVSTAGTYNFTVFPRNATGQGPGDSKSFTLYVQPPPPVPGATTITSFGYGNPDQRAPTTVTANWSAANGATGYDYYVPELGINGTTASTSFSFFVGTGGTYTFTVYPKNATGQGPGDSKSFTLHNPRPPNFDWTHPKAPGKTIVVSALEWNSFFNTINGFRGYKLQPRYDFSSASAGYDITADHINEARNAIYSMNPLVPIPDYCYRLVTDISAYYFNRLRDSLNSIQ